MRSIDNGTAWSTSFPTPSYSITTFGGNTFVGTANGVFFSSITDNTWSKLSSQFDNSIVSTMMNNGINLFFSTHTGEVYGGGSTSIQLLSTALKPQSRFITSLAINNSTLFLVIELSFIAPFCTLFSTSLHSHLTNQPFPPADSNTY